MSGQFIAAVAGYMPNGGPVTERKRIGMTFAVETDQGLDVAFVATSKTKAFPLFENSVSTLPVTGGTVAYNGYAPLSINKKTVALAADLSGGSATGALVVGRLK